MRKQQGNWLWYTVRWVFSAYTPFLEKVRNTRRQEIIWFLKRSSSRAMLILDHEMDLGDYRKIYRMLDLMDEMSLDFIMETGKKYLSFERASYLILKSPEARSP